MDPDGNTDWEYAIRLQAEELNPSQTPPSIAPSRDWSLSRREMLPDIDVTNDFLLASWLQENNSMEHDITGPVQDTAVQRQDISPNLKHVQDLALASSLQKKYDEELNDEDELLASVLDNDSNLQEYVVDNLTDQVGGRSLERENIQIMPERRSRPLTPYSPTSITVQSRHGITGNASTIMHAPRDENTFRMQPVIRLPDELDTDDYEANLQIAADLGEVPMNTMTRNEIEIFPTHRYTAPGVDSTIDRETCAICSSDFEINETLRTLTCCHKYHVVCIDKWLVMKAMCPVCLTATK